MKKIILAVAVGAVMAAGGANAGPFSAAVTNDTYNGNTFNGVPTAQFGNDGLPDLFEAANQLLGTGFSTNEELDDRFTEPDAIWSLSSSPGTIVLIGLTAGNSNTLGTYTDLGVGNVRTDLLGPFTGFGFEGNNTNLNPYPAASLAVGGNFGWFLESDPDVNNDNDSSFWFSEPGLNAAGFDHLMTFAMPELEGDSLWVDFGGGGGAEQVVLQAGAFMLGWEDLPFNGTALGDDDFDDMIYLVTSVATVPEPGILGIFGFGLAALGFMTRRRRYALA